LSTAGSRSAIHRQHLGGDAEAQVILVSDHQPSGLRHRAEYTVAIQRYHAAQVEHFGRDALGGELFGGLQASCAP